MMDGIDGTKVFLYTPQVRIASITTRERPIITENRVGSCPDARALQSATYTTRRQRGSIL